MTFCLFIFLFFLFFSFFSYIKRVLAKGKKKVLKKSRLSPDPVKKLVGEIKNGGQLKEFFKS